MKNKKSKFKNMRTKLLLSVFVNVCLAFAGCYFVLTMFTTVLKKPFFAVFEYTLMNIFGLDRSQMQLVYGWFIRSNIDEILLFICAILIIFFIYRALGKIIKYLREIEAVVKTVVDEDSPQIVLSKELAPIAEALNNAKNLLAQHNAQSREVERKKNELIMYLAHDLKTPLTSITGYLNLLLDKGNISPDMQYQYINIALEKSLRLNTLIDEFFEITKLNGEAIRLESVPLNLSLMLEQVADEMYPVLLENKLTCKLNIDRDLYLVGDGEKLVRVFDNLLKNAINYSFADTEVLVRAYNDGDRIHISMRNKCDAIPQHELGAIFERFHRLDSARSSKTGGTGLGLAISKEIIALHGGTISVESNPDFTQFTVILPKDRKS